MKRKSMMKLKKNFKMATTVLPAALIAASLAIMSGSASAGVLVSADFNSYAENDLIGGTTGTGDTGFTTNWTIAAGDNSPRVNSGAARNWTTFNTPYQAYRGINPLPDTGIIWVYFDWGRDSVQSSAWGGLTFRRSGSEILVIGDIFGTSTWGISGEPVTAVSQVGVKSAAVKMTLVGAGTNDTVELWVNAAGVGPVDVSGPALVTSTSKDFSGADEIRILGRKNQWFDNLVIELEEPPPSPGTLIYGK